MFKASIFLVAAALITLAYGWVSGISQVLIGSIAFSALAGLALLASTLMDRRRYRDAPPRAVQRERGGSPAGRRGPDGADWEPVPRARPMADYPSDAPRRPGRDPRREPRRDPREDYYEPPRRKPEWSEETEAASGIVRPAEDAGADSDFRSRLAAALADPRSDPRAAPPSRRPQPESEDVGQDWIRIDDLPEVTGEPPESPPREPRPPRVVRAESSKPTSPGRVPLEGTSVRPRIRPRRPS